MIIDFRVRPPFRGFLNMGIFTKWATPETDPRKQGAFGTGRPPVPSCEQKSMDLFIKEIKEAGIDKCVVMGRKTNGSGITSGNVLAEDLAELRDMYPDLIIPFAGIDVTDPDAPRHVEEAAKKFHFKGVSIDPGWCVPPTYADDEALMPIYEAADAHGLIISVTCSAVVGPDLTFSDPVAIQHVAKRFPNLKITVAHAAWPHVAKMIGVCLTCPNVYIIPDVYFYKDNMPMADMYATAANGFMMYRTLFASTYPVGGFKEATDKWSSRGLTPEALKHTLGENAAELLNL